MSWFTRVFGFTEGGYGQAQSRFEFNREAGTLQSRGNNRTFVCGRFLTPSLEELRGAGSHRLTAAIKQLSEDKKNRIVVKEVIGDVSVLHTSPENNGALFQAASQFNTLEHTSENGTPEHGIECYAGDRTQGPACATACAPGTIVRNYFAHEALGKWNQEEKDLTRGMTAKYQVENLKEINEVLGNDREQFFKVKNGYTMANNDKLEALQQRISQGGTEILDDIRKKLRIGVQEDTEVVCSKFGAAPYEGEQQLVTQAYCSAISVSYSGQGRCPQKWMPFAQLILEATYEATLYAAVENYLRHPQKPGAHKVFLTAVGGGVFGNEMSWVYEAMKKSFHKFHNVGLEINLVSFGGSTPEFAQLQREFGAKGYD
eukprot:TRINITY_DN75_c0_g1_i1.p1 TRINITY_DN75_c0_g1~~TRINITY_DN75_c0_g1_i1.p1  ORF type:complete len:372 (+),score=63.18 TRINITY_DN75_c0_g1_i1:130-1245(+)